MLQSGSREFWLVLYYGLVLRCSQGPHDCGWAAVVVGGADRQVNRAAALAPVKSGLLWPTLCVFYDGSYPQSSTSAPVNNTE